MSSHHTSLLASLKRFLTPQVWKQAHKAEKRKKSAPRWGLHPLLMILLIMTWTNGDSEGERFATAGACYVAMHQHSKRPGETLQGFQMALARVPLSVLHALFAGVRQVLLRLCQRYWKTGPFVVMACDASRLECPRSDELEKELETCGKDKTAPMLQIMALVLLPTGLLWSWCVGAGVASEHDQLRQLLPTLPSSTLLVGDCFYQGYQLYSDIIQAKASFLVRLSGKASFYVDRERSQKRFKDGNVYYWPEKTAQDLNKPPLELRLIRVRDRKKKDVWLLTNELSSQRLSRQQAGEYYRWRWHIEETFRTYKRTQSSIKLRSRTEALAYREAEVSLLALQLLLAGEMRTHGQGTEKVLLVGSARKSLLHLRGDITTMIGSKLGPRQQRRYQAALATVRSGGPGRKVRRKWPRRKDHKPPKPPKLRVMPERLKRKLRQHLGSK
jgi:Transposase DDE domain